MRYLQPDGSISAAGVDALLASIGSLAKKAAAEGIDELLAFATSALREAANGTETLELIAEKTGVRLQVLTGEEEGRLTFFAVRRWLGWSAGGILLLDIGGGSLEIARGNDEYPEVSVSVPLGAGRTTVGFLHNDPPLPAQMSALKAHARRILGNATNGFPPTVDPQRAVGSSKTIRSLARLAGSTTEIPGIGERTVLRRIDLKDWVPRLASMNAVARQSLPGITADRTFQIVAGGVVLYEAMRAFGIDELEVSPWALREGIILRYIDALD